ncbi:PA4575 family protein [Gilvimarinus japonicus]
MSDDMTHSIPSTSEPLVLVCHEWRVEIHMRQEDDGIATLLAYAGQNVTPERVTQQGPFQRAEQAIGARRAIVKQLLANGYQLRPQQPPIWVLNAQRDIRAARECKQRSRGNYEFAQSDVFLDW